MSTFPEPGRQAAHVLLDAVSAAVHEDPSSAPVDLAYQRLMQIDGAVQVAVHNPGPGEPLAVRLDLSNLLGASLITIRILAERLAAAEGRDVADIIVETREFIDA